MFVMYQFYTILFLSETWTIICLAICFDLNLQTANLKKKKTNKTKQKQKNCTYTNRQIYSESGSTALNNS